MTRHLKTWILLGVLAITCFSAPAQARQADADRDNPLAPGIDDTVTLVDDDGQELATLTMLEVENDWSDYPSNHTPRSGTRYVGFTIEVEALRNDVELDSDEFDLQVDPGILIDTASVQSANDDIPVLRNDITLDKGDTETVVLVYTVPVDTAYSHLFWNDDDVLITIFSAASEASLTERF